MFVPEPVPAFTSNVPVPFNVKSEDSPRILFIATPDPEKLNVVPDNVYVPLLDNEKDPSSET